MALDEQMGVLTISEKSTDDQLPDCRREWCRNCTLHWGHNINRVVYAIGGTRLAFALLPTRDCTEEGPHGEPNQFAPHLH